MADSKILCRSGEFSFEQFSFDHVQFLYKFVHRDLPSQLNFWKPTAIINKKQDFASTGRWTFSALQKKQLNAFPSSLETVCGIHVDVTTETYIVGGYSAQRVSFMNGIKESVCLGIVRGVGYKFYHYVPRKLLVQMFI